MINEHTFNPAVNGVDYKHLARVLIARHNAGLPVYPDFRIRNHAIKQLKSSWKSKSNRSANSTPHSV